MLRKSIARMTARALGIVTLSAALALGVNAMRPGGLPLLEAAQQSVVAEAVSGGEISIQDAALLLLSNRAVFLDARSVGEYVAGHIKGALSVPVEDYEGAKGQIKAAAAGKEAVITYCDGMFCPLGQELADLLRTDGIENVRVLKNGWELWTHENLPVSTGPNP
jgi:rhodanese-related sulfurtransferase